MTGDDFYALAVKLSASQSPAELRTSISRAYYAAFHNAVEFLQSIGIMLPTGPECHTKVRQILDQFEDDDLLKANSKLITLRKARNNADYRLSDTDYDKKPFVIANLKRADEIIACVKARLPSSGNEALHEAFRKYAKDVLRLTVR